MPWSLEGEVMKGQSGSALKAHISNGPAQNGAFDDRHIQYVLYLHMYGLQTMLYTAGLYGKSMVIGKRHTVTSGSDTRNSVSVFFFV